VQKLSKEKSQILSNQLAHFRLKMTGEIENMLSFFADILLPKKLQSQIIFRVKLREINLSKKV